MAKEKYYLIETYGCQMNERDSEILAGMLEELNYIETTNDKQADIIILNTCCVRETAENKVWGRMGELKHLKRKKRDLILGICGCMSQVEETAEKISQKASHMDMVFGTHNIHRLPDLIEEAKDAKLPIVEVWRSEGEVVENLPTKRNNGLQAFITIMYGCNNFCTYCIVPHVRGRERSRKLQDIKQEIEKLAEEGYKEVTLLGQNVNSYGKDLDPKIDFADLLMELNGIKGIERLRFTSSHPKDLTDRLINVMTTADKVANHIHLPIQAGSNKILKAMNRKYSREEYLNLVQKLRHAIPDISISTDLIVGFPGETEEDFQETLNLLEEVQFDAAFTFVYNKRTGTPAADMEGQVSEEAKKERIQRLITLQNRMSLQQNQEDVGQVFEVLVEGTSKSDETKLTGRSSSNKIVAFEGDLSLKGKFVKVKISLAKTWHLEGEMV